MARSGASYAASAPFGIVRTVLPISQGSLVTVSVSNRCWYYRVIEGGSISKIRVYVGTASGNVCVAAYANSGSGLSAVPGTRLGTSGSIAMSGLTGSAENDLSLGGTITVAVGDWLAIAADNTTATFSGANGPGGPTEGMSCYQETAFPCPSPAGSITAANNRAINLIGVP